jgi:hypothetical protein
MPELCPGSVILNAELVLISVYWHADTISYALDALNSLPGAALELLQRCFLVATCTKLHEATEIYVWSVPLSPAIVLCCHKNLFGLYLVYLLNDSAVHNLLHELADSNVLWLIVANVHLRARATIPGICGPCILFCFTRTRSDDKPCSNTECH